MAINLVSLVMQFLTPDMIGRIGTALELDRNKIQPAVSSAVPALLAAFNDTATQPGGSQSSPRPPGSKPTRFETLQEC